MPLYLSRFSYTPETWARLIGNPEDAERPLTCTSSRSVGSSTGSGTPSAHTMATTYREALDNVSMAAVAPAISAGGALSSLETTVLLTVDETMDALRKAQQVQYRPPGA